MDPNRSYPPVIDPAIARGWLDAVEVHLGALALGRTAPPPPSGAAGVAGIAAVAAKFLAVGTPRTMGLIGLRELAPAILAAQRAYAAPRELRIFDGSPVVAARTAEAVGGRGWSGWPRPAPATSSSRAVRWPSSAAGSAAAPW
jgi:hypothetical protein